MHNSDLIKILKVFDKKQLNQLNKFINSPYFNENKKSITLFNYLIRFAPHYQHKRLERKLVFKKFFPDKNYKKDSGLPLRRMLSLLLKLIEKFIMQEMCKEPLHKAYMTINALTFYNLHGLDNQFNKFLKNNVNNGDGMYQYEGTGLHYINYLKNIHLFDFYHLKDMPKSEVYIQKTLSNLEAFYLTIKLLFTCISLRQNRIIQGNVTALKVDALLKEIEDKQLLNIPSICIYYHILSLLHYPNKEANFNTLKELLKQYANQFPLYESQQLYSYATNYCIGKIAIGKEEYYTELFDLYTYQLEEGSIYQEDKLFPSSVKNIVTTGLAIGKFEWVQRFLETHKQRILSDNADDIYQFNTACLAFHQKNYDKTIELLRFTDFKDIYYKLGAKKLLLKTYYETEEIEALHSLLNTFKVFIHRNVVISDVLKERHKNFANIFARLINIFPKNIVKINKLFLVIQNTEELVERIWLLDKLNEKK